jgi:protein gp37
LTSLQSLREMVDRLEANRIVWTPEQIAAAATVERRMREHRVSDDDAVKAAVAFITFTPLGGE